MNRLSLSAEETRDIKALLSETAAQYQSVEDAAFLREAPLIAHELPRRVRKFLHDFKELELPHGACLISGCRVEDGDIGLTPAHWRIKTAVSPVLKSELLFALFSSLLGDLIGWATQQDGYVMHDVLPIKADENSQISSGSQQLIWWHNEDAFHPFRGDYVGLLCLRNPDRVPTTHASVDMLDLDPQMVRVLFEPRFVIRPDDSHDTGRDPAPPPAACGPEGSLAPARPHTDEMKRHPPKTAVLFGDPASPYLRLDPYYMDPPDDDEAQRALHHLIYAIDACLAEVVLQPGDCLFVDNYRAVHGRKPFTARYDGTDRWLKRVNVTRDLRKSRAARKSSGSRIIF